jgi:2-haloacid dehalogenase
MLTLTAAAVAAPALHGTSVGAMFGREKIKAVAFDALTIFNTSAVSSAVKAFFPDKADALIAAWRARQFEYCWLRTLNRSYVDFWRVTEDALIFTCRAAKIDLPVEARAALMDAFLRLEPWPDAVAALRAMREAGLRLAYLSNFTPAMMTLNTDNAGVSYLFEHQLSTDRVRAFKPDPCAYRMAERAFGIARETIVFAAFAGWDVAGAKSFGLKTFWVNRAGAALEELGVAPDGAVPTLSEFAACVTAR